MTVTCICCGAVSPEKGSSANVVDIANATGYAFACDTSDGLSMVWLCPPCTEKTMTHVRGLKEIFGEKFEYINFLPLIHKLRTS